MAADFIPQSLKNLALWLQKQHDDTAGIASSIGASAAETTAQLGHVDALLPLANDIVALQEQIDQKLADLHGLSTTHLPPVRQYIKRGKTSTTYLPSVGEAMDWIGDNNEVDASTSRPILEVTALQGRVRIEGRKPGFEAVNVYTRKKGEVAWKLLAVRKRKFPTYDETPLTTAGVPEIREYMLTGVVADEEIGQPSEIKEVVFVG